MFRVLAAAVMGVAALFGGAAAHAAVTIHVDIRTQRMTVQEDGRTVAVWPVSTARAGKVTPTGRWRPVALRRVHFSSLYDNAPMPYSIFFSGNYAIHGTTAVRQLGRPASAGCVRLSPAHARELFALVQRRGMAATQIAITRGGAPNFAPVVARAPAPRPAPAVATAPAAAPAVTPEPVAASPAAPPPEAAVQPPPVADQTIALRGVVE